MPAIPYLFSISHQCAKRHSQDRVSRSCNCAAGAASLFRTVDSQVPEHEVLETFSRRLPSDHGQAIDSWRPCSEGTVRDNVTEELALMIHGVPELVQMMQCNFSEVPLTTNITLRIRGSQSHTFQPGVAFTRIS
jgi:hypothetical protein